MPDTRQTDWQTEWPLRIVALLARTNRSIAILCGVVLLVVVALTLAEIILRQVMGRGLGGVDEISGYVMAGIAAWGFSYALVDRAHVRIDVLTGRLPLPGRSVFDLLAMISVFGVAVLVSWYGWNVLSRSILRSSRANTSLETPLWIPQSIWFGGWIWLSFVSGLLAICIFALILQRRWRQVEGVAGVTSEVKDES
jgi:TRAP-type C4-dicarboxylate transport system permease small subunit